MATTLDLSGDGLQSIRDEGIELSPDLTELCLMHNRISAMDGLDSLVNLRRLNLRANRIEAIGKSLTTCVNLVEVELYENRISTIEGLEGLSSLTSLDLSFNSISRIDGLAHAGLCALTALYLAHNKILRIENLHGLPSLATLELGSNEIRVIEGLGELPTLTELHLGRNKIASLHGSPPHAARPNGTGSAGAGLDHRAAVCADGSDGGCNGQEAADGGVHNQAEVGGGSATSSTSAHGSSGHSLVAIDLDASKDCVGQHGLASLRALRILGVASNRLRSLAGIEHASSLRELYADHNGITDLSPLAELPRLTTLDLGANRVASLDGLHDLHSLEELWLSDNRISEIERLAPITKLPSLATLRLSGCPVARTDDYRLEVRRCMPATLTQLDADVL